MTAETSEVTPRRSGPSPLDRVKDFGVPVVGTAWIAYLGLTCVNGLVLTLVFLLLFAASMALAFTSDTSHIPKVLAAVLLGVLGLGGIGIACAENEPLIEELLYVVIAGIAVTLHVDRQMIR